MTEGLGDLDLKQFLSGKELLKLSLSATAETAWDNRRNILVGVPVGAILGILKGNVVLAASGNVVEGVPQDATPDVGSYIALGIAAGAGILAGVGNGIRVYHQESQSIVKLEQAYDGQVKQINQYNNMGEDDFLREYALKAIQKGLTPNKEEAAEYAKDEITGKPEEIRKMLEELDTIQSSIGKKNRS